ncbi:MAG: sialidase family protein [Candidatus Thalassarchaeaceae archaeon]
MRAIAGCMILLMLAPMISGCFAGNTVEEIKESSPFDNLCPDGIANNTWYHYPGAVNALSAAHIINGTSILQGENVPMCTKGTYYGIGFSTFEPTIGITSADNLYMTSWGNGPGGSTAIIRCTDMIEMVDVSSYSCENTYQGAVANSNDPYVYVDRWTDRIMKFDMHALAGMTVEWSDDEGETWGPFGLASFATGYSVQDHQTIASSPYNAAFHETTWVFCVNGNWQSPLCSTSNDGGLTWGPEVPGAPVNCNSGGLTGHMVGANDGNFYRGNPSCDGEGYSIYRSTNGGLTWTEHELPTDVTGMADTWNFEEAQVYPDEENNLHAMWMGADDLPYYSYSFNQGDSWSAPLMVAPPGLNGTGFPAVAAGDSGKVAFAYLGDTGGDTWNGYISIMTDSFSETPLITTVQVNEFGDPLSLEADCGYNRCGGFGDFIDILVDNHGRAWFGLSHNIGNNLQDEGIYGTTMVGPSLRGSIAPLNILPEGGPKTLA